MATATLASLLSALAVLFPVAPAAWAVPVARAAEPCGPVVADPLAQSPWALTRLRPDLAWPLTRGAGVTVAVIDSGVSPDHPSLAGKVRPGADFLTGGGTGQCDENGHGTLIAGIIAGRETVSAGFRFHGVAPDATIVPVRVLRDERRSFEGDLSERIATAVRWAVDSGRAGVINLSLTTTPTPGLEAAIRYAVGRGVVVVSATGNEGTSQAGQPTYPAAYDGVIAVTSTDGKDEPVESSNTGAFVDVAAPGVDVAGPSPAGGGFLFSEEGGTSFAAAYVSGVAALIRAYDPDLPPDQVSRRITATAAHPASGWNPQVGYGIVDPARAVGALPLAAPLSAEALPGRVQISEPGPDTGRGIRLLATWIAVGGAATTVLLLIAVPVVRRARAREWRSGPL